MYGIITVNGSPARNCQPKRHQPPPADPKAHKHGQIRGASAPLSGLHRSCADIQPGPSTPPIPLPGEVPRTNRHVVAQRNRLFLQANPPRRAAAGGEERSLS
jgi:hypothetical protein